MKAKHHFASSIAVGGVLYWVTGSPGALAGAMVGGFLIDGDHLIDQVWTISLESRGLSSARAEEYQRRAGKHAWAYRFLRRRKLLRLPLIFHSYELLVLLTAIVIWLPTPFLMGLAAGYATHLILDWIRHRHEFRSPLFYSLLYRLAHGFRRDRLVRAEYL